MLFKDDTIQKAHKYIRRWKKGDKWEYKYPKTSSTNKSVHACEVDIAKNAPFVETLPLVENNSQAIESVLDELQRLSDDGEFVVESCRRFLIKRYLENIF